jgi:uncharacterized protein
VALKNLNSIFLFFILSFGFCAEALDIPVLNSPVIDEVGLLSQASKKQLEHTLFNFRETSGIHLQVYVIQSLAGDSIESVAIQVFDKWKLGDEKLDRGLLFLIAPNEKRLRIEVGQGLEGDLPDVIGKRIVSDVVAPYFKRGEYAVGIFQGVSTIQNYLVNTDPEQKAKLEQNAAEGKSGGKSNAAVVILLLILWFIIFLINPSLALHILFAAMSGGRSGGGGGRSWSGGGGRSSGGGASGGW